MIVRALDANGDFTFGRGRSNYLSGNQAIGQSIVTRLKSFLGDCFFDLAAGIDWFNLLGAKNELLIDFNIKRVILNTENVTGITELSRDLDRGTRLLTPVYLIDTAFPGGINTGNLFKGNLLTELGDILTTESGDPIGA